MSYKIIGLIPARRGSKRLPGKNMALLGGKPLLQRAIEGAEESDVFDKIVISSDWDECIKWAKNKTWHNRRIGALERPPELCRDSSHDYEWVKHALDNFPGFDIFVILRPTSPFRTAETIKRALKVFIDEPSCHSMRAVERTKQHPLKSWRIQPDGTMLPYWEDGARIDLSDYTGHACGFDLSTQSLGDVYCQNGCIHVARANTLEKFGNVSGYLIKPFFTEGRESVDINTPEDLEYAEWLMGRNA